MKKLTIVALLALISFSTVTAQDVSFGVTTGFHNLSIRAKVGDVSASSGENSIGKIF